jgi:hypothetical protein
MLRKRPLLIGMLVLFTFIQVRLSAELMAAGFDWRPLWGAPIVRASMVDFSFTMIWCALYVLDAAQRQRRNGWAWVPLVLILPTLALILFTLSAPEEGRDAAPPG